MDGKIARTYSQSMGEFEAEIISKYPYICTA
jgi:hypothetical protein